MALIHLNFHSDVLGMAMQADVILPQKNTSLIGMQTTDSEIYKTLWLLHGLSDDNTIWQRRTSIERYASERGIAVVMVNADRSWYCDMKYGGRYFTYLTDAEPGTLTYDLGVDYLFVVMVACAGVFFQVTFERLLQATGKAKLSMYTQGLGAIVNIILDPIFILSAGDELFGITLPFGLGMGTLGAALATVIGQFTAAGVGLFLNLTNTAAIWPSEAATRRHCAVNLGPLAGSM